MKGSSMWLLDFTTLKSQVCYYYILLSESLKYAAIKVYSPMENWSMLQKSERFNYVTIRLYSVKDSSMLQLYFTPWKAQVCDNYISLSERLKYATVKFYSVKGSSMWLLYFTPWKAQVCDN